MKLEKGKRVLSELGDFIYVQVQQTLFQSNKYYTKTIEYDILRKNGSYEPSPRFIDFEPIPSNEPLSLGKYTVPETNITISIPEKKMPTMIPFKLNVTNNECIVLATRIASKS